jgi:hypothetical protein
MNTFELISGDYRVYLSETEDKALVKDINILIFKNKSMTLTCETRLDSITLYDRFELNSHYTFDEIQEKLK